MKDRVEESWLCEPCASVRQALSDEAIEPEAPHQRLLREGVEALSEAELLAVLLADGAPRRADLIPSLNLLARIGGLAALLQLEAPMLTRLGIAQPGAARVQAVAEICRRVADCEIADRLRLDQPQAVARLLARRYENYRREVLGALFLDTKCQLVASREIFRGTRERIAVEPSLILREALLLSASSIVLFHNHPSGDPTPSVEDISFTHRLADAATLLGLKLRDHLVLGSGGQWHSIRDSFV